MDEQEPAAISREAMLAFPLMHRLLRITVSGDAEHFTRTQFYILTALHTRAELSMTQIAQLIGASKEQATRAVAPLVDMGLAERTVPASNRTRVMLHLTAEGAKRVAALLDRCAGRMRERLQANLTAEEQRALQAHLAASAALLQKVVDD